MKLIIKSRQKEVCKSVIQGYVCIKQNPLRQINLLKDRVGHYQDWHLHPLGFMITLALSPRARDENTKRVAISFLSKYQTRESMLLLTENDIILFLKESGFGMYNVKGKVVYDIIQKWPGNENNIAQDIKFKGVGPKVYGIYKLYMFNKPYIAADTHISKSIMYIYDLHKFPNNIEKISYMALHPLYKSANKDLLLSIHGILFALNKYGCATNKQNCILCTTPWKTKN